MQTGAFKQSFDDVVQEYRNTVEQILNSNCN